MIAFDKMRTLKLKCVVATDLISRGVDLPDVQVVINLVLPSTASRKKTNVLKTNTFEWWHDLVHRIGRAGRFGQTKALAINLVT